KATRQAKRFNEQAAADIERIRDFIVLHYVLTERNDTPFWDTCRTMEIPETLKDRIALFRESGMAYQDAEEIFRVASWAQVMIGQRMSPREHHRMGRIMGEERLRQVMSEMRSHVSRQVSLLPTHHGFIDNYCKDNKVSVS
ncbi:MAG: tryptophan halogenase, partial [Oxalobacteraceae bacterium]